MVHKTIRYVVQMVCHVEMFHDYVLSVSHNVLLWLLYMMCKLQYDDEGIVKTGGGGGGLGIGPHGK